MRWGEEGFDERERGQGIRNWGLIGRLGGSDMLSDSERPPLVESRDRTRGTLGIS